MKHANILLKGIIAVSIFYVCIAGYLQYKDFYHDDALISLRYGRNFINGDGLVWNPSERIEGYSNFLFIILVSIIGKAGVEMILSSQIVGVLSFIILNLFAGYFIFRKYYNSTNNNNLLFIPAVFTATSFPLIIWSLGGLEGVLYTLLCTIGMWHLMETMDGKHNQAILSGILFAFIGMTRVDGTLFFIISCLFYLIFILIKKRESLINLIWFTAVFTIIYGCYFLWRFYYYGQFMPNTYYVKSGYDLGKIINGFYYIKEYFITAPFILPLMFIGLIYSILKKHWHLKMSYLLTIIIIYIAYIIYMGGDHMPAFRLFLPIIPSSALLLFFALEPLKQAIGKSRAVLLYGLLIFLTAIPIIRPSQPVKIAREIDSAAFVGTIVGNYIAKAWPPGSLVALNTAGSTPYFAPDKKYIDMLGLNDTTIARREIKSKILTLQNIPGHEKGDGKYVLSRKPDYIILGGAEGIDAGNPWFLSDYEISISPDFENNYCKRIIDISVDHIDGYNLYPATQSGILTFIFYEKLK